MTHTFKVGDKVTVPKLGPMENTIVGTTLGGSRFLLDHWAGVYDTSDLQGCKTPEEHVSAEDMRTSTDLVLSTLVDTNPKTAFGDKKPPLGLVPPSAIRAEAEAMRLGAQKYGAYNWRKNPVSTMTYIHAALRHLHAILDGQNVDPESGQTHLAHVRACCGIVIDAEACGMLVDDRPPAVGDK